jgi:hypothetical protein
LANYSSYCLNGGETLFFVTGDERVILHDKWRICANELGGKHYDVRYALDNRDRLDQLVDQQRALALIPAPDKRQTEEEGGADESAALSFKELLSQESESRLTPMIIEKMFPAIGISVVAGDSTIGKSALVLMMAVCVAGGKSFLDLATVKGKVLIVDWENGDKIGAILQNVARVAGVSNEDLEANVTVLKSPSAATLLRYVRENKPAFITLDAFRWLMDGNESKTELVTRRFKDMADAGSSWVLVHHLRKQSRDSEAPSLEDPETRVALWFQEVSGSLAITNQSFTRVGVIAPKKGADLLVRWVVKLQGEFGPLHVDRVFEDDDPDKPVGYERAQGQSLMSDAVRDKYLQVAGKTLTFVELTTEFGNKTAASRLKAACESLGLVKTFEGKPKRFRFEAPDTERMRQVAAIVQEKLPETVF